MKFYFNKIIGLIKILLCSKWIFSLPDKKKILVIDAASNPFGKYFKEKDINILYCRGEKLNILILLSCLINLKLSILDYYKKYIYFAKPKVILTNIDHHKNFYYLSDLTKIKTVLVQRAKKTLMDGIFSSKEFTNKKNKSIFYIDHIFVHNSSIGKIYNTFTRGKTLEIGSFINNMNELSKKKKKREILFISTYKPHNSYLPDSIKEKKIAKSDVSTFFQKDKYVIKCLSDFAYKKNIKFNVLGRNHGNNLKIEKEYFDNIINKKYNFIANQKGRNSNKTVEQFEFVFTDFSTLGIENLVKNGKTGFIFCKPNKYKWFTGRIGYFEKLNYRGPFWTTGTTNNKREFERVFNFVIKTKNKAWEKIRKKYSSKLMIYDPGNKKFLRIIYQYLN